MPALSNEEQMIIKEACDGQVIASTAARLYEAKKPTEYQHTLTGGLALLRKPNGQYSFCIVDPRVLLINQMGSILWEYVFSGDVKYQAERPFFHSFVGAESMIGLSFADEEDARVFHEKYQGRDSFVSRPSTASLAPPSQDIERRKSKKEGGWSLFGRKESTTKKGGKIDKSMISAPSNFEHVSHVGFNAQSGFSVQNIPPEWKIIFQKAGITDEQLQDKKQQKVIKKFMKDNAALVAGSAQVPVPASQPPQPSQSTPGQTRRAPPPPPPSRKGAPPPPPSRGAPPPPPSRDSVSQPVPPRPAPSIPDRQPSVPDRIIPQVPERVSPAVPERTPPSIPDRQPPSIPSRQPPQIPTRQPVPSAPIAPTGAGGAPPPPPPPPVGAPMPPPAPTMSPNNVSHTTPSTNTSAKPKVAAPQDLLSEIRSGKALRSTSQIQQEQPPPPKDTGDSLADALRDALQKRVTAVAGSGILNSLDSEDEDDDW